MTAPHSVGRPRPAVDLMPAYRPGKAAAQAEAEHGITDAIKLASNENPLPPIQSIVDAVTQRGDRRQSICRSPHDARCASDCRHGLASTSNGSRSAPDRWVCCSSCS